MFNKLLHECENIFARDRKNDSIDGIQTIRLIHKQNQKIVTPT